MRLKPASAAIFLGCMLMLSACGIGTVDSTASENLAPSAAIGDASASLIAAMTDPCKLDPGDPFWKRHGGQDGYDQRCGQ